MRKSKNCIYEIPYSVKGTIQFTGLEEKPTGICKDRFIGTWKPGNVEDLLPLKRYPISEQLLTKWILCRM